MDANVQAEAGMVMCGGRGEGGEVKIKAEEVVGAGEEKEEGLGRGGKAQAQVVYKKHKDQE